MWCAYTFLKNVRVLCVCTVLLCGCASGCAGKQTANRPKDVNARVNDIEHVQQEQDQRLAALENRVGALQQRTYDVYTAAGQKTRYVVRAVDPVPPVSVSSASPATASPVPIPVPANPVSVSPTPPLSSATTVNPSPATAAPRPAPPTLMLPSEAAPASLPPASPPILPTTGTSTPAPALPPEGIPVTPVAVQPPPATPIIADAKLPPSAKGEEAAYTTALNLVRAGQYAQGREKFQEFLNTYPAGRYAANAYYWMGESFYAQNQYADALAQFRLGAERFPKHHKTADALLKAGMASQKMGDTENAARQFRTLLTDFPRSEAAQTIRGKGWER